MNPSDFCMNGGCWSTYIHKRPNIGNALRGLFTGVQSEKDGSNKTRTLSHMSLAVISTKHIVPDPVENFLWQNILCEFFIVSPCSFFFYITAIFRLGCLESFLPFFFSKISKCSFKRFIILISCISARASFIFRESIELFIFGYYQQFRKNSLFLHLNISNCSLYIRKEFNFSFSDITNNSLYIQKEFSFSHLDITNNSLYIQKEFSFSHLDITSNSLYIQKEFSFSHLDITNNSLYIQKEFSFSHLDITSNSLYIQKEFSFSHLDITSNSLYIQKEFSFSHLDITSNSLYIQKEFSFSHLDITSNSLYIQKEFSFSHLDITSNSLYIPEMFQVFVFG